MAKKYWFSFTTNPSDSADLSPTMLNFIKFDGTTLAAPGITQPITGTGLYQFTYTPTFSIAFKIDGATTGGGLNAATRYIAGSLDPLDRVDELLAESGTSNLAFGLTLNGIGTTNAALGTTSVALGTTAVALGISNFAFGGTIFQLATNIGVTQIAEGATIVAIGNTVLAIGNTLSVFGSSLSGIDAKLGSTASSFGSTSVSPGDIFGYLIRLRELLEGAQTFAKTTGVWNLYARDATSLLAQKTLTNSVTGVTRS